MRPAAFRAGVFGTGDGDVYAFGTNRFGELGAGSIWDMSWDMKKVTVSTDLADERFRKVVSGLSFAYALSGVCGAPLCLPCPSLTLRC